MRDIYKLEFDLFQDTTMVLYSWERGSRVTRARCKASNVFAMVPGSHGVRAEVLRLHGVRLLRALLLGLGQGPASL